MLQAFKAEDNGESFYKASQSFGIPRKTLVRRYRKKNAAKSRMGPDSVLGEQNENRLVSHIKSFQESGLSRTREDQRRLAFKFAEQLGVYQKFNSEGEKAGYGWLQLFLSRHPDLSVRKSERVSLVQSEGMNKLEAITLIFWKKCLKNSIFSTSLLAYSTWMKLAFSKTTEHVMLLLKKAPNLCPV